MPASRDVYALDQGWEFKQTDDTAAEWLPVSQFPTNIHLDLMHHGIIPDPFVGKNELKVQWVGEKAWSYRTSFDSVVAEGGKSVLVFDGLDTHATVVLNGEKILDTENMFIPERVEVTHLLKPAGSVDKNVLEITFHSTWFIGKELVKKFPDHNWYGWNGDKSRLAVRKAQCHYGWDWGPKLMTCGPWRPISLEVYTSRISQLYFTTSVDKSLKSADVVYEADVEGDGEEVVFTTTIRDLRVNSQRAKVKDGHAVATWHVEDPELWYPHTYGKQPLYVVSATLLSSKSQTLDESSRRFGIRRAEVVQKPLQDQEGTSFYFEINNIPVFCGGSDWIPADTFIPRIKREQYYDWIRMVVECNQVMIRVWGGGIYEQPAFYEACDEMGVLVWQDFMFACGNYPTSQPFLDLIDREARETLKTLRHHPSIVLWAGNNEDYWIQMIEKFEYDVNDHEPSNWLKTNFPARYIYEKLLVDATKELAPNAYYHFGSPYGGKDSMDPAVGDIHQWNVWHGAQERYQDFDNLGGRFVSEFGLEAFPSMKTIDSFLPQGASDIERYPQSSTVDFHNRSDNHERRINLYIVENVRVDYKSFDKYVYCTQLVQAECVTNAYRLWRRQWKGPGREYCAGALVWQTNDCWPVTSWSIIDYYLRPKQAYYAIKRELALITIGMKRVVTKVPSTEDTDADFKTTHKIEMWASNFSLEKRVLAVQVKAWDVVTGEETFSETVRSEFILEPNRSTEISEFDVPVKESDSESQTVVAAYLLDDAGQVARCVNWPEPLKYVHLQEPKRLRVDVVESASCVEIEAEVPLKGLTLEADDGVVFSDNSIDVVPGEVIRIGAKGLKKSTQLDVKFLE